MITPYFINEWLRWLIRSILAVAAERLLFGETWQFTLAALLTLLLFLILTSLLYGDWRSARRSGVHYIYRR